MILPCIVCHPLFIRQRDKRSLISSGLKRWPSLHSPTSRTSSRQSTKNEGNKEQLDPPRRPCIHFRSLGSRDPLRASRNFLTKSDSVHLTLDKGPMPIIIHGTLEMARTSEVTRRNLPRGLTWRGSCCTDSICNVAPSRARISRASNDVAPPHEAISTAGAQYDAVFENLLTSLATIHRSDAGHGMYGPSSHEPLKAATSGTQEGPRCVDYL